MPAKDGNPMQAVRAVTPLYMKYSAANSGTSTSYVTISWKSDFSDRNCLNENNGSRNILGWYANSPSVNDAFSDWVLEPVNDLKSRPKPAWCRPPMAASTASSVPATTPS